MRLSVEEAFRQYGDRVFSAAFSICQTKEDADDAVQDTFLKYYTRNEDYIDETHLKAWLLRVAINRAKDITGAFWRRNRVSWEDYMDELEFQEPEDRSVFEAVMRLPEKYRMEITDSFNSDGVCFVQLKNGSQTLYLTVKYQNGYATSPLGFVQSEEFN